MSHNAQSRLRLFTIGLVIGVFLTSLSGLVLYKLNIHKKFEKLIHRLSDLKFFKMEAGQRYKQATEGFSRMVQAMDGKSFGRYGQLSFELYRNGTFEIDGKLGYALQKSSGYRDAAIIRSTHPLPKTYKISAVVGGIDYGLEKIENLAGDPEYPEGPNNENGCYLLAMTDTAPVDHHTNIWWHQHRKIVMDVDNNTWGHGMPNPLFMVYFDKGNTLVAFDGENDQWQRQWRKAITYEPHAWYKIEIEKTKTDFILKIYDENNRLLKKGTVLLKDVWHEDGDTPDYLVIGDPHENYYQGAMKIKSITMPIK